MFQEIYKIGELIVDYTDELKQLKEQKRKEKDAIDKWNNICDVSCILYIISFFILIGLLHFSSPWLCTAFAICMIIVFCAIWRISKTLYLKSIRKKGLNVKDNLVSDAETQFDKKVHQLVKDKLIELGIEDFEIADVEEHIETLNDGKFGILVKYDFIEDEKRMTSYLPDMWIW